MKDPNIGMIVGTTKPVTFAVRPKAEMYAENEIFLRFVS